MYILRLCLLGAQIEVHSLYEDCHQAICEHFSTNHIVINPILSPDVIIKCNMQKASKFLFRSRPIEMQGSKLDDLYFMAHGMEKYEPWFHLHPPIPPFCIYPIKHRFVGVHAGCLRSPNNVGVLIVGAQGAGKTTLCLELANKFGYSFLTDEVVCIHKRSSIIEPFIIAPGISSLVNGIMQKKAVPINDVCSSTSPMPTFVKKIIFLEKGVQVPKLEILNKENAFKKILAQHLDIGCNMEESFITLHTIIHASENYEFINNGHNNILSNVEKVASLCY